MESVRSDLARASAEFSATAAAADPDLEASAVAGKGNKSRAFSQDLISVSDVPKAAATLAETTSEWTGQKRTKINSTHATAGEHSSVGGQGHKQEWFRFLKWNRRGNRGDEIDGLDWDDDKLTDVINGCLRQLKDNPVVYLGGAIDDESFTIFDEQGQKELDERLALCRIKAYEEKYQDMDNDQLSVLFPSKVLEDNKYFLDYEYNFEWYFDPVYCQYADFHDYQRLVLRNRNNAEYENWEFYRRTCSSLESDQAYIKFWENLLRTTQIINWYITKIGDVFSWESRIEKLLYYHTLKIAAEDPNVYKTLVDKGCNEFKHILWITYIVSLRYADFFFEMWKLLTGEKLSFKDALERLYNGGGKYSFIFPRRDEFEPNLRLVENLYKPFLDLICEKAVDEAKGLIMDHVTEHGGGPKTYYDYVKKKLGIAEKIGLIPSPHTKAPSDKKVMVTP